MSILPAVQAMAGIAASSGVTEGAPPTGYEQWRVVGLLNWASGPTQMREAKLQETTGGPNVATGGTVSVSSTFSGLSSASIFDGNSATIFAFAAGLRNWLSYEFSSPVMLGAISFLPSDSNTLMFKYVLVQYHDGADWVSYSDPILLGSPVDNVWLEAAITPMSPPEIDVFDPHRHWRINCIGQGQDNNIVAVQYLELIDASDVNVSDGAGTVTYTSFLSGFDAYKIFTPATSGWASDGTIQPQFVAKDFGAGNEKNPVKYEINIEPTSQNVAPTSWRIECSDDGVNWQIADERLLVTWGPGESLKAFDFTPP